MSNETIILELLERIQALETKVKILETKTPEKKSQKERVETTPEMVQLCYLQGEQAFNNPKIAIKKLVNEVFKKTGMPKTTAEMYIYAVKVMLQGIAYKRAIKLSANETYFNIIWDKYGKTGLAKALKSTREHIKYRQDCNQNVDSLIKLCEKYEKFL